VWEMAFGLNHTNAMDGTNDLDGDTMINRDEWIAGTDPQDPLSYLKIDDIDFLGQATLRFIAISNKSSTIQFSDGLESAGWQRLTDVNARPTNRNEVFVVDPDPRPKRYYR